jgi:hypothetical protein
MSIFPGPTPAYNNPTIEPQDYQPSRFEISAISLGQTTTVTTSEDHNYVIGQLVRLLIPSFYGTYELSGQQGYVISIPASDQIIISIDSSSYTTFISSPTYGPTAPQIVAIGDLNSGQIDQTFQNQTTYVSGSFINIS